MAETVQENCISNTFFNRPTDEVARDLIGVTLLLNNVGGIIVETEAYDDNNDCASHCYNIKEPTIPWKTALNKSMYLSGGHAYVCPGRHLLHLNLVCGDAGRPSAVLIRAIEPLRDCISEITRRRQPNFKGTPSALVLCAGPGCVGEALGVACEHDGKSLYEPPFQLLARQQQVSICCGTRVGVNKNDLKRRYTWKGNKYVSRPWIDC